MKRHSRPVGLLTAILLGLACGVVVTLFVLWAHPVSVLAMLGKMLRQPLILFLNWLPIALLTAAFAFAFRNVFFSSALVGLIAGAMSLINRVKLTIRGEPFVPRDISLIKEAADAAGSYDMTLPWFQIGCLVVMTAVFIVLGVLLPLKKSEDAPKKRGALVRVTGFVLCLAVLVGAVGLVYSSTDLYNSFETTEPYNLSSVNNELGFVYYFCYHFSTYKIEKPEGFDRDEAASWETGYESAPDAADVNVVFVMNEAFSDILNEDVFVFPEGENPMEVYNTLAEGENAWAGHIVVPYFAGGTADTEFDVASGMQTNLLNPAAPSLTAFRTVNRDLDSIFRVFGADGYTSCFMHPGQSWFYNRENVYDWFGADESFFVEDFDAEYKGSWVTDESVLRELVSRFEEKSAGGGLDFTYAVTIQNHMSYTAEKYGDYVCPEVETTAELSPEIQTAVNVYAEGIRDANAMLEDLTEFYSEQSEPVLLVFFGDHLPYLGDNRQGYAELGLPAASVTGGEDPFAAYTAPVLFWCNDAAAEALDFANAIEALDLPADGRISACYLGAAVLELTGRGEVSPWFAFLNEMRRELPVLHNGYYESADGEITTEPTAEEAALVSRMRCWAYYKLRYGVVK
ncbi:MAG: LTA synthase family protein [Oscillospiraceae bacterium]|nr:LTA synthase family protein [Oscillospiraceae bacterium]